MLDICARFAVKGDPVCCEPYGCGHINDTYLVRTTAADYILQRVNTVVFRDPVGLMNNIALVTEYLADKCPPRGSLHLIRAADGGLFFSDDSGFYRMYDFVTGSVTYQRVESSHQFELCGRAFGDFQQKLSGFDASRLCEVIPKFHDTGKRYRDFEASLDADRSGRAVNAKNEIEFVKNHSGLCTILTDALADGTLRLRVTHNDTKLNNILFDQCTGEPLCVIDLDTIMPGLAHYDFGDSIRFGASTAAEDEPDLSKVNFSLELFESYTRGFFDGCSSALSDAEKLLLPEGAILMTLECGMRFLADYIDGDVYFKTSSSEHNLIRSRTQFKLVSDMERLRPQMQAVIEKYMQ